MSSNDGERLLAKSIERYYRSRGAIRSSGFRLFLCHAGLDRDRMVLERPVSRKEQPGEEEEHSPIRPACPTPASAPLAPHQPRSARDVAHSVERGGVGRGPGRVQEGARAAE